MKKKNGFTLVELLVVIALMLSILGIAIVSFVNISNKKKEEAWKEVINQIETAASEYFTANEYLFEGLQNGSSATIAVGKLVEDDYLNTVTNPVTEKKVSECAVVTVTKEGDKYTSEFKEDSFETEETSCDSQSLVITSDVGKTDDTGTDGTENTDPDDNNDEDDGNGTGSTLLNGICLDKEGNEMNASDANGYCYQKKFQLNTTKLNKKGTITSVKYCNRGDGSICKIDDVSDAVDITDKYTDEFLGYDDTTTDAITVVDIYNQSGALTRIITTNYKIDQTIPMNVSIGLNQTEDYKNASPIITLGAVDENSGIDRYELEGASSDDEIPAEEKVELTNTSLFNSSGDLITDFLRNSEYSETYVTSSPYVKVYDKVGNYNDVQSAGYQVYRECDTTIKKTCKHTYSCDCNCDKNGKNCKTCSCAYYKDYYVDKYDGAHCGGDTYCTTTKTTTTKKSKPVEAKAYKFAKLEKFCSNTGTFNFNHAGDKVSGAKINMSPKGAYRKYKFQELECSCTLSNNRITVNKVSDITEKTHPDGNSYIFYNSKTGCNNNNTKDVKQVCTQQITSVLKYHGVIWRKGSGNKFSGEGWYSDSYTTKKTLEEITSKTQACKWACESKAGIN